MVRILSFANILIGVRMSSRTTTSRT